MARSTLRPWRLGDDPSLVRHANNPNVARNLKDLFPQPYTMEDALEWIARNKDVDPPRQFAIVVDRAAVGGIGIEIGSDIHRRSAEIGYWLGEDFWGRGIVTEAVGALTQYAFATFDLEHVFAGLFVHNVGSRRVLEKNGYELEGRLRRHVTKNGETMDDLLFGIVRPTNAARP